MAELGPDREDREDRPRHGQGALWSTGDGSSERYLARGSATHRKDVWELEKNQRKLHDQDEHQRELISDESDMTAGGQR